MLKKLTIGKRITLITVILLVIIAIISIWATTGIYNITGNAKEVIYGNQLRGEIIQRELDHLNWANSLSKLLTDKNITSIDIQTDPKKCGFGEWYYGEKRKEAEKAVPGLAEILEKIEKPHNELHHSAVNIQKEFKQADLELGDFLHEKKIDHLLWMHAIKDSFLHNDTTGLHVQKDPTKCSLGKWFYSIKDKHNYGYDFGNLLQKLESPHRQLHESAKEIDKLLRENKLQEAIKLYGNKTEKYAEETLGAIDKLLEWHDDHVAGMNKANSIYAEKTKPSLEKIQGLLGKVRSAVRENIMTDKEMLQSARNTNTAVIIIAIIGFVVGILISIAIVRGIVHALSIIVRDTMEGSEQVASASNQISDASQSLAEGATEQAASLEESSSALEEMASMTKQNSENSRQANSKMQSAVDLVKNGTVSVSNMKTAMSEINDSSDQIKDIMKVIEEIAFQTNLLALNAAVEAARAGDAGKGFAVVADEVRSLAQRSGEAVKNTSELIENTISRIENGNSIVKELGESFSEIDESSTSIAELISEITSASEEQAQGIDQVNIAVAQMDKVTQSNAANSEETASASEELSAQAEELQSTVEILREMIYGNKTEQKNYRPAARTRNNRQQLMKPQVNYSSAANAVDSGAQPTQIEQKREFYPWTADLSVGVDFIDNQHKKLIGMINRLHESFQEGDTDYVVNDILEELVEYTKEHFATEENMMDESGYPALDAHNKFHAELIEKLNSISEEVRSGKMMVGLKIMDFLRNWLNDHIKGKDKSYAPYMQRHGW